MAASKQDELNSINKIPENIDKFNYRNKLFEVKDSSKNSRDYYKTGKNVLSNNPKCCHCGQIRSRSYSPELYVNSQRETNFDLCDSNRIIHKTRKQRMKQEFILFCRNTTIRGVSRIVKSEDKSTFLLWLGFFILLCVGLLVCMFCLLRQYLEYNVIHPPRVLSNQDAPFPSFTVCNLRPLSYKIREYLAEQSWRNPRQFAKRLNKYAINLYRIRGQREMYEASTAISSMGGYLESIENISQLNSLGHSLKDIVISCMVSYVEGNKPLLDECTNVGEWRVILHPQYMNCYSYVLYERFSNKTNSVELFIYLAEEFNTTECLDCFFTNVKTQLSGAALVIHKRASYPDINQESVNLQPGTLTEVKLKTIKNLMKTPPYGRCSPYTQKYLKMSNYLYAYSENACKFYTFQQKIRDECQCVTIEYPFLKDSSKLPFCTALPSFLSNSSCPTIDYRSKNASINEHCRKELEKAIHNIICKNNIIRRYHGDGIEGCYLPCVFYSYETDRSISTWPTKSYHLRWLQSSVARNIEYKSELQNYQEAIKSLRNGDKQKAYEILTKNDILEKKLVGVVINKPNYNLHVVEEKEVLSLTSFFSQSGGLFSIWIGLTLINIVEIIEMFIRMGDAYAKEKQHFYRKSDNTFNGNSSKPYIPSTEASNDHPWEVQQLQYADYDTYIEKSTKHKSPNKSILREAMI